MAEGELSHSHCWQSSHANFDLLPNISEHNRCDQRHLFIEEAIASCAHNAQCGSVVRDGGLRCGSAGRLMHFETRSARRIDGFTTSWKRAQRSAACGRQVPPVQHLQFSAREKWLLKMRSAKIDSEAWAHTSELENAPVTLLVSGTLRGFRVCARTLYSAFVFPNARVHIALSTYDQTDCMSHGYEDGLGPDALRVNPDFSTAYNFEGVQTAFHMAPASTINRFRRMHKFPVDPVIVRYQSQFWLRSKAWETAIRLHSTDEDERVYVVVRPDACFYGSISIYRAPKKNQSSVVQMVVRDGSICRVKLSPNELIAPWSDIHENLWDDTFAIGYSRAIRAYAYFHERIHAHEWPYGTKVEHVLERYLRQTVGVRIIEACGIARGDQLSLNKNCTAQ